MVNWYSRITSLVSSLIRIWSRRLGDRCLHWSPHVVGVRAECLRVLGVCQLHATVRRLQSQGSSHLWRYECSIACFTKVENGSTMPSVPNKRPIGFSFQLLVEYSFLSHISLRFFPLYHLCYITLTSSRLKKLSSKLSWN